MRCHGYHGHQAISTRTGAPFHRNAVEIFTKKSREHTDFCYWMPYEELRHGAPLLRGMFEFLNLPWRDEYEAPLDVVMR